MDLDILKEWEAEANFFQNLKKKIEESAPNTGFMDNEAKLSRQVISLIQLVRNQTMLLNFSAGFISTYEKFENKSVQEVLEWIERMGSELE